MGHMYCVNNVYTHPTSLSLLAVQLAGLFLVMTYPSDTACEQRPRVY